MFYPSQGPIAGQDANFASARVHEVYNTDLVNTLGNSLSRTSAMINKYYDGGVVPGEVSVTTGNTVTFDGYDWPATCRETKNEVERAIGAMELPKAAAAAIALVVKVDLFITEQEPFRMAKDDTKKEELGACLYQCLETLRVACVLLEPFLPNKMAEVNAHMRLGEGTFHDRTKWGGLVPGSTVTKMAVFPRKEALDEQGMPVVS